MTKPRHTFITNFIAEYSDFKILKLLAKNLTITMIKCIHFWVGMNDISHVMKKHQQPVTESQTLDGASCCYSSQRSKVVAAVGRLRLRASSRCCYCRVRTTRRRQLKAAAPSSTQHNIVQDFFGGQRRRRRLRVVLFSVLATILTLGKRGLG